MRKESNQFRFGLSLLEMLVVVTILGIIAVIIVPRFGNQSGQAKTKTCGVNKGNIEVQCQLWFRQKGAAPQSNLSDIRADANYFPDGLPPCPVDGSSYTITPSTLRVNGHNH